ncbi:MAG: DNA polymerase IV [Actinobacteria bacterium]|nr:DNA polymerase IV [Actinomycetota bacterium]
MDMFFVAVELLDRPELRGQPVIVGGSGERGVVAAASYEARAYGIHSAMSSVRAQRLCPHAVFLSGRFHRYSEVSREVMAIFRSYTPLVEPLSLDEAFLDVTGSLRLFGSAVRIGSEIRRRVGDEQGLTCSVGIAPTKFVAKLASEAAKPTASPQGPQPGLGVKVVERDELFDFLHPLPVGALWGVGPATHAKLDRLGVRTVGDLAALRLDIVVGVVGQAQGRHLHALATGIDERSVEPERRVKSIGHEETFAHDRHDRASLERELVRLADGVGARMRAHDVVGRTITLKVRFHDFRTITRSVTLAEPTGSTALVAQSARVLLGQIDPAPGVRLLGMSVSGLAEGGPQQLSFDDVLPDRAAGTEPTGAVSRAWTGAEGAVDAIRDRFGAQIIGPATLAGPGGIRRKRRGDQQWGPHREP